MSGSNPFDSKNIIFGTLTGDDIDEMMRSQEVTGDERPPWTNGKKMSEHKRFLKEQAIPQFSLPINMRSFGSRAEATKHPVLPIGGLPQTYKSAQHGPSQAGPSTAGGGATILTRRAKMRDEPMAKDLPRSVLLPFDAKIQINEKRPQRQESDTSSSHATTHAKPEISIDTDPISKPEAIRAKGQSSSDISGIKPPINETKSSPSTPPAPPLPSAAPGRSAMKQTGPSSGKTWADLIRGPTDVPNGKRVSILGPGETDPTTPTLSGRSKQLGNGHSSEDKAHRDASEVRNAGQARSRTAQGGNTSYRAPLIYPRGLVNHGNTCFANVILQILIHCPPFYNFLALVAAKRDAVPGGMDLERVAPLLAALTTFLKEFKVLDDEKEMNGSNGPAQMDSKWKSHLVADPIYQALRGNKKFDLMRKGRQEDAEEFLGLVLEALHDELDLLISSDQTFRRDLEEFDISLGNKVERSSDPGATKASGHHSTDHGEDHSAQEANGWMEVGPKQKTSRIRSATTSETPITRIFGGKLRSILQVAGSKSSVTLEPFWPLQLDIERDQVTNIENALINLTDPDVLTDLWSSSRRTKVEGNKQVFIDTLPPILLIHLKRFLYDEIGGTQKSLKLISYDTELTIPEEAIAPLKRTGRPVKYHLLAVVYHHGSSASGGHYTTDLCRADMTSWINIDDVNIRPIKSTSVALDRGKELMRLSLPSNLSRGGLPEKVAYLLAYVRAEDGARQPR